MAYLVALVEGYCLPEEHHYMINLAFKTTNNKEEYEVVLAEFTVAKALGAKEVDIRANSLMVINQLIQKYAVKTEKLKKYLQLVWEKCDYFRYFNVMQISQE